MKKDFKDILSRVKENWNYYMNEFKNCLNDIKHKDTFYKQIPNLLTIFRVVGIIPVSVLFITGNMIPGTILLCILLSTDFFDGKIARKYGIESKFGADLDAICDKIMSFCLMLPLLVSNPLLTVNLMLEIIIAMVNVNSKLNGREPKTKFSGKIKTWFLSLTIGIGYMARFISFFKSVFSFFALLTIPTQIKTIYDYNKAYVSNEYNELKTNENENISFDMSKREQIMELEKEKDFLLSSNTELKEEVKAKKKVKKKNITLK